MRGLEDLVARQRIIICAGSGGVGKTTTAAALALRAALLGRRTIVMTIDPAKRLANALGVDTLGSAGTVVSADGAEAGMLSAMMLDQKGAWDELVERHAPSPEVRDRILANHFYQHLSQSFAGSQEYMAIEQLCELHASDKYDLIVVDTPPTRHALDFLEAPQRIADFLDRSIVKWFVRPYFSAGWATMRFVNRTVGFLFRRLEEATGVSALSQVSEFFSDMSGLFENFEPRVRRVYELLRARETAFILVASPEEQVLSEAEYFLQKIGDLGMSLRAVILNRVHSEIGGARKTTDNEKLVGLLRRLGAGESLAGSLAQNLELYESLGRGDTLRVEAFRRQLKANVPVAAVPNFTSDVHSLAGLRSMHPYLFRQQTGVSPG
ncbi:MAG TPA: ArsA-related P-loop ATPase [Candidatus Acidoferrales bacterium]|nr:ArsA-related P-loop ATPase [Candidatus Acidoferrales bacterium]